MKNKTDKKRYRNCFVSSCRNKMLINQKRRAIQFFRVPDGIEGLFWNKAVKIRHQKYDKLINLLSSTDPMLGLEKSTNENSELNEESEYCCEFHFDINKEIERIVQNGSVEYKIKPGAVPSIKPRQKNRLRDINKNSAPISNNVPFDCEFETDIIKSEETMANGNIIESNDFNVSLNEALPSIERPDWDVPHEIYYEVTSIGEQQTGFSHELIMPMLPLTAALMKRKSLYYMGMDESRCFRLFQLAGQVTQLSETKVMITLRKLCLNEEFEVLGDLFDIDEATAEQYFHESKQLVNDLVDRLATPTANHVKVSSEFIIKIERCAVNAPDPIEPTVFSNEIDEEDDHHAPKSPESMTTFDGSDEDPNVKFEDLDSSSSSSDYEPVNEKMDGYCIFPNVNTTTCGLCLETFETKLLVKIHQKDTHCGASFGCDLCGREFGYKESIKRHIETKHTKMHGYVCNICGEEFVYQGTLSYHMKGRHLKKQKFQCDSCEKKYFDRKTLDAHIRAKHSNKRKGKAFQPKSGNNHRKAR